MSNAMNPSEIVPPAAPARRVRPRPQYRAAQIRRVQRITPHMCRITVCGEELAGFSTQGVAGHVRVLLPAPGQQAPALPTWGPDGPVYPEGVPRPTSRAYTPRRWDAQSLELDIDFVLHGDNGPASAWAARAKPGDRLVVVAPRRAYQPDPSADWHLLAGDESALPAIATILEVLPAAARALVYVEVLDAAEEQILPSPARVELHWLHRGDAAPGARLESAVRAAEFPEGDGRAWVACEAVAMRSLRRHLLGERGMDRAAINTQGYWKLGAANHPDHDTGEEI
jgi:NADPH-dependent ferric siderophore reductase